MISHFFIDRPIFASVLSIVVTLAGGIAVTTLPVAQYPQISPPTVSVDCNYPGASAQVVSETVATPIEQQVNGVENMLYMSSQCTNDGTYNLTVTFKHGVNLNMAQVLVQNRVSLALPLLPDVLKQTGVNVKKRSPDILLSIAINSPGGVRNQLYLSNYALLHIKDELARLPGVSDVTMLGQRDYSMRIWVDPEKLASRNMTAGDVVAAIRDQNMQVATGQIGQQPVPDGAEDPDPPGHPRPPGGRRAIRADDRPRHARRPRHAHQGRRPRRAGGQESGHQLQGQQEAVDQPGHLPAPRRQRPGDGRRHHGEDRGTQEGLPPGVAYEVRYNTTPYIRESINEVFKTLREAILLVAIVVLLFLQNWRSAIIPLVAVPVAIVGTFAAMAALGFSLNNLTLFGLVLAIGIVVDDAIVVVEAVEHHIEHGLSPRDATFRAMDEVSGPVIAIGLVLTAVFVPCAFISGIVGQFFRQFALTIAVSTVISAFNSLTLSPALAALLLRPRVPGIRVDPLPRLLYAAGGAALGYLYLGPLVSPALGRTLSAATAIPAGLPGEGGASLAASAIGLVVGAIGGWLLGWPLNRLLSGFFALFNAAFKGVTWAYNRAVGGLLRVSLLVLVVYGGLLCLTAWGFANTPTGFIPSQDMGYLLVNVQLPDSASAERTIETMDRIEAIAAGVQGGRKGVPGVKYTQIIAGQSLLLSANGSNFGSMFVILDDYDKRHAPELYGEAIAAELRKRYAKEIYNAVITVLGPPPVRGVGRAGGFKLMIEDRGDIGSRTLQGQTENLVDKCKQQPGLVGLVSVFRANVPSIFVDVDRKECMSKDVALRDLFDTMRIYLGSLYVNDFNRFGRTWQVVVQADQRFRNKPADVRALKVRNNAGNMVPLGSLANVKEVNGPLVLTRYNMYPAAPINGAAAVGVSSGEAIAIMERMAKQELLPSMSYEWTELAYLELQAGSTAMIVFGLAVVMVFLVLAAQYESWSLPLAIILVVPMCLLSAIIGVRYAKQDVNIFTQIGFVVLVGLASKNAILIVEFAKQKRDAGESRRQAALEACTLRLRPIIMTSLAFILGVVPLILSNGAGAEMRRTLGTTVFSGMLGVTLFGIFLTPVFFFVIDWLGDLRVFRSPGMRRVSNIALAALMLLTLGPIGALILMFRFRHKKSSPAGKPSAPNPADPDEIA